MSVLIGRRELFAFAERYASQRLRDYSDLADGVVLCRLFSLVFPSMRVQTASPQTHTASQRSAANWTALRSAMEAIRIPTDLLDAEALARNDTEKGFSALVLFYFMFHLTKRADFAAEFAMDVTEELTVFLQSIESIEALVAGGALSLESVPPQLRSMIRCRPAPVAKAPSPLSPPLWALPAESPACPPPAVVVEESPLFGSVGSDSCGATESPGDAELRRALHLMTEECEALRLRNAELLSQLSPHRSCCGSRPASREAFDSLLEARAESAEAEVALLRCALRSARAEIRSCAAGPCAALLNDITDTETGEAVDVHATATRLHALLLDALRSAPGKRREAQQCLWRIVSAFHVLETRLAVACDVARSNRSAQQQQRHEQQLREVHVREASLRQSLRESLRELEELRELQEGQTAATSAAREEKWRALCAALHAAERASFRVAEAETTAEVEKLLEERNEWYARADEYSAALVAEKDNANNNKKKKKGLTGSEGHREQRSDADSGHAVCAAMEAIVQSVTQDRDELQRELDRLRGEMGNSKDIGHSSAGMGDVSIETRLAAQREYEEEEIWGVRTNARPPFTLSAAAESPSSGTHTPIGRNLSALLAAAR